MPTVREIAESRLQNVGVAIEAARAVGLPLHIAFALLDMESEGRNFFGSDSGGMYKGETVTQAKFEAMEKAVAAGKPSNGVGPTQITYRGFFPQARAQGLKLWEPYDNMIFGFTLLAGYLKTYPGDYQKAGRLFNGKDSYGNTFVRVVGEWKERLKGAGEETPVAAWHLAPSFVELQKELDAELGASRPNDGTIGDEAHAARSSEHNPDNDPDPMPKGAVSAIDVYSEANGKVWITDAQFKKFLAVLKKDSRVWYVIHKKKIYSRTHGWAEQDYTGTNPHNTHIHISLMQTKAAHDSKASWKLSGVFDKTPAPDPEPTGKALPVLSFGDSDAVLVPFLKRYFYKTPPNQDAKFGSGTREKVIAFQKKNALRVDGVVGKETWKKIVAGGTKLPAGYKAP